LSQAINTCSKFICRKKEGHYCSISGITCKGCRIFHSICTMCAQNECKKKTLHSDSDITPVEEKKIKTTTNENKTIPTAYVDGSFKNGVYGYGCVITRPDGQRRGLRGHDNKNVLAEMRNVAGELLGAMAAIQYAIDNKFPSLTIYYDYIGIEKWAKDEWRANKPATQEYKEFIKRCPIPLTFVKVKGHSGDADNELADQLAKKAVGIIV